MLRGGLASRSLRPEHPVDSGLGNPLSPLGGNATHKGVPSLSMARPCVPNPWRNDMNSKTEIGELQTANRIANELLRQSQVLRADLVAELAKAKEDAKNANRIANELLEQSQVLVAKLVAELSEADEDVKNARLIADYLYIKARTIQLEVSRSPEASGC